MFPDVILIAVVVGLLRGGRLGAVPEIRQGWVLVPIALMQVATTYLPLIGPFLMIGSYLLLLYLGFRNWESVAFRVLSVGTFLNALVTAANGGSMPIDHALATRLPYDLSALEGGAFLQHTLAAANTPFAFLGDTILLQLPIPRLISLGDVFAIVGLFLLVQELLGKPVLDKQILGES